MSLWQYLHGLPPVYVYPSLLGSVKFRASEKWERMGSLAVHHRASFFFFFFHWLSVLICRQQTMECAETSLVNNRTAD